LVLFCNSACHSTSCAERHAIAGKKDSTARTDYGINGVAWKQVIEKRANTQWALAMFRVFGSIVSGPLIMNIANSAFPKLMSVIGTKADQNHAG
jgi:hypothetical protein